jgi:dTDP-4-amino-4,6-dideoxygalactose transaminase
MNNHFFIELFEKRLGEFTGSPYVVLTDSCTNAIFLCLIYLKRYKNFTETSVTIPKQTYVGVAQSIINAGLKVSFEDIKWVGSYNILRTPIVDAAVGFTENMYKGGMVCLSFQQKKSIPIGKGGAILLNDKYSYDIIKRMSWDGRDASKSVKDDIDNIIPGYHMNMIPDDAAKGILKLNQYVETKFGSYIDYPDISICFNESIE